MAEVLDRDLPGVFQLWESDLAEVRKNPAAIHNVGGCEQHQLHETIFADYAALGAALLVYYDAELFTSADREVDGEIDDETLEREDSHFEQYLTFDLRAFLKERLVFWAPIQQGKLSIGSIAWPFYKQELQSSSYLQLLSFTRNSAGAPEVTVGYHSLDSLVFWAQRAGSAQADQKWLKVLKKGAQENG